MRKKTAKRIPRKSGRTRNYILLAACLLMSGLCACHQKEHTEEKEYAEYTENQDNLRQASTEQTEATKTLPDLQAAFSSWQEAYATYIAYLTEDSSNPDYAAAEYQYALIYLNDDTIPELYFLSCSDEIGESVATWYENHLVTLKLSNTNAAKYIAESGLLYHYPNKAPVHVYQLKDGAFSVVATGSYSWDKEKGGEKVMLDSQNRPANQYEWEGTAVPEATFDEKLHAVFDTEQAQRPQEWYPTKEILSVLETGATCSAGHRYEVILEDSSWTEAQARCHEKGGYLATITSPEERQAVQECILQEGRTDAVYFVGYRTDAESNATLCKCWIAADGQAEPAGNLIGFWEYQAPDYSFVAPAFDVQECGVLRYYPEEDKIFLITAPDALPETLPEYAGKTGYICEYDTAF